MSTPTDKNTFIMCRPSTMEDEGRHSLRCGPMRRVDAEALMARLNHPDSDDYYRGHYYLVPEKDERSVVWTYGVPEEAGLYWFYPENVMTASQATVTVILLSSGQGVQWVEAGGYLPAGQSRWVAVEDEDGYAPDGRWFANPGWYSPIVSSMPDPPIGVVANLIGEW